jgi:hypothetical protein
MMPKMNGMTDKHGRRGGFTLVGSEVVPFRGRGEDALDEARKGIRRRAQLLARGFNGRPPPWTS